MGFDSNLTEGISVLCYVSKDYLNQSVCLHVFDFSECAGHFLEVQ